MTGYASASVGAGLRAEDAGSAGLAVSAEVRSVNARFLVRTLRLRDELRGLGPALRDLVAGAIKRGFDMVMLTSDLACMMAGARQQPDELKAKTR